MRDTSKLKIEEHPLLNKALGELRPLLESIDPKIMAIKSSKERHSRAPKLSAEQTYHHCVFWYAKNMVEAFKQLNQVTMYIRDFPKPRSYFKQGITQYDWSQYHLHVYIVRIVSLYDIALKLTNGVFRLGVEDRQVRKDTVEDNLWVNRTRVSERLCDLRKSRLRVRKPRNLFVHSGDLWKLDELDMLEIICLANKLHVTSKYSANSIRNLFQSDINKLANRMSKEISSLEDKAIKLFDELMPVYDFWSSFLKMRRE